MRITKEMGVIKLCNGCTYNDNDGGCPSKSKKFVFNFHNFKIICYSRSENSNSITYWRGKLSHITEQEYDSQ